MKTTIFFPLLVSGMLVPNTVVLAFSTPRSSSTSAQRMIPSKVAAAASRMNDMDFLPARPSFVWKTLMMTPTTTTKKSQHHHHEPWIPPTAIAIAAWTLLPEKAVATAAVDGFAVQYALTSYAHIFSLLAITGCLVAERLLIQTDMTRDDEETVARIDLAYGLLAALLIGSGFAKAMEYGKGGDFYCHEILFWMKMTLSGVWGGLSIFPTIIFRQRTGAEQPVPELSEALVARLHSIINAEISAIWTIPVVASMMSMGVGFSPEFPWQAGAFVSLVALVGSFWYYGKQALEWSESEEETDATKPLAIGK